MATELLYTPSLWERLVGSHLVVTSRAARLREIRPAQGFEYPRRFGLFELDIVEVVHGRAPDRLVLRILSEREDGAGGEERPKWSVRIEAEGPVVLLLARDSAPDVAGDLYVPYFASVFPIEADEWVVVGNDAVDDRTREIAGADQRGRIPLEGLRRVVRAVTAERDERHRELEALLPERWIRHPYPPVLEQPGVVQPVLEPVEFTLGGGRPGEEKSGVPPEG